MSGNFSHSNINTSSIDNKTLLKNEKDILRTLKKIEHISSQKIDNAQKGIMASNQNPKNQLIKKQKNSVMLDPIN